MRTPCSTWNLSPASADGSLSRALEATASSVRGYAPPHRVATLKADQSEDRTRDGTQAFMGPPAERVPGEEPTARRELPELHVKACPVRLAAPAALLRSYSRIGITTYFVCAGPGAWIRQLLFESVSPISTFSLSIAPRASRR